MFAPLPHRAHDAARVFVAFALALSSCGGRQQVVEQPRQPLEARRATQVIAQALGDEGLEAAPGRSVVLVDGKQLEMDVGVRTHKFGVAYTTQRERDALGDNLAPREHPTQLQLVVGAGADEGARVLILHETDYMLDDAHGTNYEASTITAERRLARDVRDFVVQSREARWP